jgi:adenine-specific DNA glycosylase
MIAKPRSEWKPRAEWAKRVRGRVVASVSVKSNSKTPDSKLFVFEMTENGVLVRRKRSKRSAAKLWSFTQLANGAGSNNQMVLL